MSKNLRRYGPFALIAAVLVVVVIISLTGGGKSPTATTAALGGPSGRPSQGEDCARQKILAPAATACKPLFQGDNGGATSKGVTDKEVGLVWYAPLVSAATQSLLQQAGLTATPEQLEHAVQVYTQFLNQQYQAYGRNVKVTYFRSQLDAGQNPAALRADAVKLDEEQKTFMVLNAGSSEFLDELARRKIVAIGGNQFPAEFYTTHQPYLYGQLPDADSTNAHIAEYISKRLGKSSTADFAGEGVKGKPRKYGILYPATTSGGAPSSYSKVGDDLEKRMKDLGLPVAAKIGYTQDQSTAGQQSTTNTRALQDAGVTTVICLCDLITPLYATQAASAQGYNPEWFQSGYLLQDTDFAGRLYDQKQMTHAFGISTLAKSPSGATVPPDSSAYKAWKTVEPDTEPPPGTATTFTALQVAFAGIENAGPKLNPTTLNKGMFEIKITSARPSQVSYSYGPNDFGGIDDAREVWWDPESNGPDGKKGTWQSVADGFRYLPGKWPATPPKVFDPACLGPGTCGAQSFPS